jgi:hypothetical protein
MTRYLAAEVEYVAWYTADLTISYLDVVLASTDFYGDFRVSGGQGVHLANIRLVSNE